MPNENGGRADKLGNRYEGRWIVKQLLRVVNEEIYAIMVEPIGPEEIGVDVWIYNKNGSRECQQCKARNASEELWSIGDLNAKGILNKSKVQLGINSDTVYALVSPLSGTMLTDLHQRAITVENEIYFYEYQIKNSGKKLKDFFAIYCKHMGIDIDNEKDLKKVYDYMKRTIYYQYPDDKNEKMNLLSEIGRQFVGDSEVIYSVLSDYCIEKDLLGKQITSNMVLLYLRSKGVQPRNLALDERILPRINTLNKEFKDAFSPIYNTIIYREEIKTCIEEIEKGNSVVIHGKAGSGKSGCIYGILEKLEEREILPLALKLDRRVPNVSAQKYGDSLDLPASPVYCLYELSKCKSSVIILDQLDAIRWTNSHSATAVEVCKEIIGQVQQLNQNNEKNISIIFVCRTYDYINDKGIQSLFKQNDNIDKFSWKEIIIGDLDDKVVKEIVGSSYDGFSYKMKSILKTINNLYIWAQLDEERRINEIKSSTDLIKSWWEQLLFNYEKINSKSESLIKLKNEIVLRMEKLGRLIVSENIISRNYSSTPLQYLISQGLIKINSKNIMFVHQNFFDYFLVEKMLEDLYNGATIMEIIGGLDKQTPMKRYQVQMFLQILQEENFTLFVELSDQIIQNENIRFYMKYAYLEVLSQSSTTEGLEILLKKYIDDTRYNEYFYETVFRRNKIFILFLINEGYINRWLEDKEKKNLAIDFMASVCETIQHEIIKIITPILYKNKETDFLLYNCFPRDIASDSDDMFSLRVSILEKYQELRPKYLNFKELSKKSVRRAVLILKLINEKSKDKMRTSLNLNKNVEEIFGDINNITVEDGQYVIKLLLPLVPMCSDYYEEKLNGWTNRAGGNYGGGRVYVAILKKAMKHIIEKKVEIFISLLKQYENCNSIVINEIFIESLIYLPETFSNTVLNWMLCGNEERLFNINGEEEDQLLHTKRILSKFSKHCDLSIFKKVESYIIRFKEKDAKDTMRIRRNYFKEKGEHVYWSFWGELQYSLLPSLEKGRILNQSKELIKVLNRKFDGKYLKYKNLYGHHGGFVQSSISLKADSFSNSTWEKIILNNKVPEDNNLKEKIFDNEIYETSVRQFAQTLESVGKKNPERFAKLALELPNEISDLYITSFLNILGSSEMEDTTNGNERYSNVSIELAEKVILKFRKDKERSYDKAICWNIERKANEIWSKDIVRLICDIAINSSNPKEKEVIVTNAEDKEIVTYDMLLSNSMNCTRGAAAYTLGILLWKDYSIYPDVKIAVQSLIKDKHPAVRMAAIQCLCPIYNIDKEWAKKQIIGLFESDIRILAHSSSHQLVYRIYKDYSEELNNIIKKMFYSQDKQVSRIAANYVCNLYLEYGDFDDLIVVKDEYSIENKEGIMEVAIELFDDDKYTEKCKMILEMFITDSSEVNNMYLRLFLDKKLKIHRDKEFILSMFKLDFSRRNLNFIVEFLQETEERVLEVADIIFEICTEIINNYRDNIKKDPYGFYGIEDELSKLIIGLYDAAVNKENEICLKCLDIWDNMFKYRIGSIRALSKAIMEY